MRPMFECDRGFNIYQTLEGYFVVALYLGHIQVRGPWDRVTPAILEGLRLTA